jgi:hypothetical protein
MLFAAKLGLIAVASTGLRASIGGARGGRATSRLGPRARCRGAHEAGSPELWGSIATP